MINYQIERNKKAVKSLTKGLTFAELKKILEPVNHSWVDEYFDITWTDLRKVILKLNPNAEYMKIKDELELKNGHEVDRTWLSIDWEDLEVILLKHKTIVKTKKGEENVI